MKGTNRLLSQALFALLMLCALPVHAQRVSGDLNGLVTSVDGSPVVGATVTIEHLPSGTTRVTETQDGGRFTARGLRIGGPYQVTVEAEGYSSGSNDTVQIDLGEPEYIEVVLESDRVDLEAIQVVGTQISTVFNPDNMGATTTVTREEIEEYVSISESISDYARLDPRVAIMDKERGEISVGGGHNRFNNVLIDGVPANDAFGLNSNAQPATNQTISIDWIEQISVDINPVDVSMAGASGGFINSVTKSGDNEFRAFVTGRYRDDAFIGEDENDNEFPEFEEKKYGAWVSGPIIEDTLFFFFGAEHYEFDDVAASQVGLLGDDLGTIFPSPREEIQQVIDIARDVYGIDIGQIDSPGALVTEEDKYIGKIDWNINDFHRFSFRYNKTEGSESNVFRDNDDFGLTSHFYDEQREYESYTAQLFSDWNDVFSTEIRATTTDYTTSFDVASDLPEVTIDVTGGDLLFGTELFRQQNRLGTTTDNLLFKGNVFTGLHSIDFGAEYYAEDYDNVFVFGSRGNYQFDSIDEFAQGNVGVRYEFRTSADPDNPDLPRAIWGWDVKSLFLQDTYQVTGDFTLQYGLRWDLFNVNDRPPENDLFEQTYGFSNQGTMDGEKLIQPRIGFNWQLPTELRAQLRGGFGLYRGRSPGVWMTNPFTNPGGTIQVFTCGQQRTGNTDCIDIDPDFIFTPDTDNQPRVGGVTGARQDVDVVEDGIQVPSDWKFNLAIDFDNPWMTESIITAELTKAWVNEGLQTTHLNLGQPTGVLPDGRLSYWCDADNASGQRCNANSEFNDVLFMENTGKGERTQFLLAVDKEWTGDWGNLYGKLAGVYMSATDTMSNTSSRAISNWDNTAVRNPNELVEARSNFESPYRFTLALRYTANWFDFGASKFGVFWEHRAGRPFSWAFDTDANGDRISDNDLLYVPNPGDVIFTDPAEEAIFYAFVAERDALREAQGTIIGRNTDRSPSVNQMDIQFTQEFDTQRFGTGEFYIGIENFLNLINDDWGHINEVPFEYVAEIVDFDGIDPATGKMIYDLDNGFAASGFDAFTVRRDAKGESRWSAVFGVRWEF